MFDKNEDPFKKFIDRIAKEVESDANPYKKLLKDTKGKDVEYPYGIWPNAFQWGKAPKTDWSK